MSTTNRMSSTFSSHAALGQRTARSRGGRDDEERLTADIVELARQYSHDGNRKIAEVLRRGRYQ